MSSAGPDPADRDATPEAVAWLFPGQGSLEPTAGAALGRFLSERGGAAGRLLDLASDLTGGDVRRMLARSDPALARTEVQQPVVTALSLGCLEAVRLALPDFRPGLVAGHSLGELAAWAATGAISVDQAVRLAATRGRLMAASVSARPGGLLALLTDERSVQPALELGARHGCVELAAENAPEEWVVAGDEEALRVIGAAYPSRRLPVSGAWHGTRLSGAAERFRAVLSTLSPADASVPYVACRDGKRASPAEIPDLLAAQICRPVRFRAVLSTVTSAGVTRVLVFGPGRVLRGLCRKNLGSQVAVLATESSADLERAIDALRRGR